MLELHRQAELWANGATIHNVNGLIGMWEAAEYAARRKGASPVPLRYCEECMACANNRLAEYMRHGNYTKACEDNPLPDPTASDEERKERE